MPTTVVTGRDLTITLDFDNEGLAAPVSLDAQATEVVLTQELNRETYETLAGRTRKVIDDDGSLAITMLADWGTTGGVCAALWSAADTAPDTPVTFSFQVNGDTFAGKVYPVKPDAGGSAPGALELSVEMPLSGDVTRTAAA